MALVFEIEEHKLTYKKPATTSRGALNDRRLWLLKVFNSEKPDNFGIGECGIIPKLSPEDTPDFDKIIISLIDRLNNNEELEPEIWQRFPAFRFAYETAMMSMKSGDNKILFDTPYSRKESGIKINGLVWMAELKEMISEAKLKISLGFDCIKFKIGALDFDKECRMIEQIRKLEGGSQLQIRVDANGAFPLSDALLMLKELKRFDLHSIEQPIAKNQWDAMEELCAKSPVNIALDEELIEINLETDGEKMLKKIRPQWIILKPSLIGGLAISDKWIKLAEKYNIGWWATSALESNIGLNAIAQWVSAKKTKMHQGLGTGQLYEQNFAPETKIKNGELWMI